MVAFLAYALVIVFMILIMTKKMSPFAALTVVPLVFGIGGVIFGIWHADIGAAALNGLKTTSVTAIMLLFAVLFFTLMIDTGLFDPLSNAMIRFAKGDPLKVMMATVLLSAGVSLNGDGTTTMIIVCSAFVPIYKKLNMKLLDLAVLTILSHSIMNLLPWGGPTARVIAVLHLNESQVLRGLVPMIIFGEIYMVIVAYIMGKQERKRLGILNFTEDHIRELTTITDPEVLKIRRPKKIWINLVLTIIVLIMLIWGIVPSAVIFIAATALGLVINYTSVKEQRARIEANMPDAGSVAMVVIAAGIFMGILSGTHMDLAIANSMSSVIPDEFGKYWGLIVAFISAPGTFFLSNDAFYFGVLPVLAKTGATYGFTSLQLGFASLIGQAFHLLSPLVPFIYVLLRLTDVDMGQWQKKSALWGIGIFVIYILVALAFGLMPLTGKA
ncbi:citM protein [Agrilactobacillus composti DSM 18527 = JCM 14202]|uniref:CitM protein n=1 Tax=Agrilactobacillus composti DSM 18527 = JCM 14202 TaxID=1423734 RepID=X0PDD8_9LACO|nr:citrate:proton symporter [Agrilactobacillus composti]KRM30443.1 citM protein [Agrilactobacillus composti DSM 18527 = JCM 14202]GAF38923.1 Mg2+/citrate complex transporter [Agrilactobacillus composti DSM 18527 = JCM 14202]